MVRAAIESLYKGTCTIFEWQELKDPVTKITKHVPVEVLSNQPCRLSYKSITAVSQTDNAASVKQVAKLFIAPEIDVKPGSKISVTQNGTTKDYQRTGESARYTNQQEIVLELFKGWS